jgi:PAS domain S-box-containing protein
MSIGIMDAHRGLQNGEFVPYFQPLIIIRTGQLAGFEMLARWNHPTAGVIAPDDFIPLAERDGWIGELTQALLRKGFAAAASLHQPLTIALNISPVLLHDGKLPEQIRSAAELTGFSLNCLVVEITESALTSDMEHAGIIARQLKAMGCGLALDDFGKGYSSLLHLQSLPFDKIKIDRSFVSSMTERRESRKIVGAVVGLGQSLGLTTIAEGVETLEQDEMLLWLGCDLAQGWLYGRPVPAEELLDVVSAARQRAVPRRELESIPHRLSSSKFDSPPAQRLAQLQAVYDGAPVGLAFLDCNLRYVTLNRRLAEMNGFSMEEHLGRTVAEMIPELWPTVEPYIRSALKGVAISDVEVVKPRSGPNGGKTILLSYQPARDEAGEVVGVSVSMVDITAFKQAQEARLEAEEHFRHMLNLNPQIPWILDPDGKALNVSQRWEAATGASKDEWKDFGWLDALHPDDRQPTKESLEACLRSGKPIDVKYRVRRPGCEWRWMRARGAARFNEDGKILFWYGGLEEVEEHERADNWK